MKSTIPEILDDLSLPYVESATRHYLMERLTQIKFKVNFIKYSYYMLYLVN